MAGTTGRSRALPWMAVAAGGFIGAVMRWLVGLAGVTPMTALWIVNLTGAAILGALSGSERVGAHLRLFAGTGICGALTTYSSMMPQTLDHPWQIVAMLACGCALAAVAYSLTSPHTSLTTPPHDADDGDCS